MTDKNIKAGATIHSGDGGYGIGTQENYSKFVKIRNQSLTLTTPAREWVGLTPEDIDKAKEDNMRFGGFRVVGFAYDLEQLLKERNTNS